MAAESDDSPAGRAVLIFFAVLALYVLSIGPLTRYGLWIPTWVWVAYRPVGWAEEHCEPLEKVLNWYTHVWGDA